MEDESIHVRYLILIAAVLCAVLIGYNAFYVPDAALSTVEVTVDVAGEQSGDSSQEECYTPSGVSVSRTGASDAVEPESSTLESGGDGSSEGPQQKELEGKINLNTASAGQLVRLDGIGDALADRIIRYREQKGGFNSVEEIKNVSGIGDKKYEQIRNDITVE